MHVAIIADGGWIDSEPTALRALEVGLLDEQVRVTQVLPEHVKRAMGSGFSPKLTWRDSRVRWWRQRRLLQLAGPLREAGADLVHAMTVRMWVPAAKLACELGVPVVFNCPSMHVVGRAGEAMRAASAMRAGFTATTQPIAEALRAAVGPGPLIERVPPGVHVPDETVARRAQPEAPCLVITGTGRFDPQYAALFEALRVYVGKRPQAQFFLEAHGGDQHTLWQAAQRMGLLTHISIVPLQASAASVLLQADAVLQPQASGRTHSFTLNAMAEGVPVLALADPALDYLLDGQTAWVIDQPQPHRWTARLDEMEAATGDIDRLIASARAWCSRHHLVSHRVVQVLKVYHALQKG